MFGVQPCFLTVSHLMQDVCKLLGIWKLNTTAHHPECDGMVENFNRTLKTMLRKQWDEYIAGALWAYRISEYQWVPTEHNMAVLISPIVWSTSLPRPANSCGYRSTGFPPVSAALDR